jgi:hypothetical protein
MKIRINPWFTDDATRFLNNLFKWFPQVIKNGGIISVLEWGGGNSTIWLLQKGCKILTIESDQSFIDNLSKISADIGFRTMVSQSVTDCLNNFQDYDCVILQANKYENIGDKLFSKKDWDLIINDGIDRLKVLEAITCYSGSPIAILDNSEYCANWGKLERCSAHPDRVKAYRNFLRSEKWKNIIFEQQEGREGRAIADNSGWEAPHRWATAICWPNSHILTKMIVTQLGFPLLNIEGQDDGDILSLPQRCRFDWEKMRWIDNEFSKTLQLNRKYD